MCDLKYNTGSSLVVQRVRLLLFHYRWMGSIPDWGTTIPHAAQCGQKNYKNKKDFPGGGSFHTPNAEGQGSKPA